MSIRRLVLVAVSVIAGFVLAFSNLLSDSTVTVYDSMWFLPLLTGVLFLCVPSYSTDSISKYLTLIIEYGILVRNVLGPLFLGFSNFSAEISGLEKSDVNYAVFLMLFETLCILVAERIMTKKIRNTSSLQPKSEKIKIDCGMLFKPIILFLIFVCVICILMNDSILTSYMAVWNIANATTIYKTQYAMSYTIFTFCFEILKMMIIVYGFSVLQKQSSSLLKIAFIITIVFLPSLFSAENYGYIIINILASIIFSIIIFPEYKKSIYFFTGVLCFILVLFIATLKSGNNWQTMENSISSISMLIQGYFCGISNVAGTFKITEIDKWTCFFYDLYFTLPFRNTLFGVEGDYRSTVVFNLANNVNSQIIPCLSQGYLYFGFFGVMLSSLLVVVAYNILLKMDNRLSEASDYIKIFMAIYFALTPFMYNYTILGSWLLMLLIPALIVFKISKKFLRERR